jgi:integrase
MPVSAVLDAAGRRRSPATMPGYHAGRPPRNNGQLYPADPPTVEEIVAVMREANDDRHGFRLRALIVVLWRGGLRVQEALALGERDLDPGAARCSCETARAVGAARSAWTPGASSSCGRGSPFGSSSRSARCSVSSTARPAGRPWSSANVRVELRRLAAQAGVRRRFAPHQLRHAHAVELAREGMALNVI